MSDKPQQANRPSKGKWLKILTCVLLLIFVLVGLAPWILAKTTLRDRFFAAIVNDSTVEITSSDASFGYFSPLSVSRLNIRADNGDANVRIQEIRADKSWLSMLFDRPQLGTFTFVQPAVDVTLKTKDEDDEAKGQSPLPVPDLPVLSAVIKGASITVREQGLGDPAVDIKDVNVTFRLTRVGDAPAFQIDPITVFDRQALTPELCNQGLQLVAPLLAEQVDAQGEFSFRLDQFQLLFQEPESENAPDVEIAGTVELHQASIALKDSMVSNLVGLIARLVDREIPDRLDVAEDTRVDFHVADQRIQHQGFAMVLPHGDSSVNIRTSGSVGLDRSLDVLIEIELKNASLDESKLATHLVSQPILVSVTGTIDDPQFKLASADAWTSQIDELISALQAQGDAGGLAQRTVDLLGELLTHQPEKREQLFPNLGERIRERRDKRRQRFKR